MLATHYAWSNGGKTLTLTIRQGVKWNDGKPMSASDVAFTFNLLTAEPDAGHGRDPAAGQRHLVRQHRHTHVQLSRSTPTCS